MEKSVRIMQPFFHLRKSHPVPDGCQAGAANRISPSEVLQPQPSRPVFRRIPLRQPVCKSQPQSSAAHPQAIIHSAMPVFHISGIVIHILPNRCPFSGRRRISHCNPSASDASPSQFFRIRQTFRRSAILIAGFLPESQT